jgi:copper oxidase (laccase) domain-containing protein
MLCVVTADCTPVFLYDPVCGVAGMLHSGRAGTMKDISGKAVLKMQQEFGSKPRDIRCILGPYLCARHHEVERKDIEGFFELFSESECERFLKNKGIKYYVDMGEAIRISLMKKGVLSEKRVGNRTYYYLKYRDGKRVISQYVPVGKVEEIREQVEHRKHIEIMVQSLYEEQRIAQSILEEYV